LGRPRALARALRAGSTPLPSGLAPGLANVPDAAPCGTGVLRREAQVPFEQLVEAHAPLRAFVADLDLVDAHFTACFQQYLQDDILTKVDRATARYGLEARVPLLDRRVVELAARIPVAMKITPARTKHIFVEAMAEVLPPSVLSHPKRGFGLPWPMLREPLWRRDLEAMLASVPAARALVDSTHAASWSPMTVWRALSLVYWLDEHPHVRVT
jgi:asparagine synthetase B (glutamine-hydrolysing)